MEDDDDYAVGGLMDEPEDYYPPTPPPTQQTYTMRNGKAVILNLVGASPTEAHRLWNGAKMISDYFEEDQSRVMGKTILELGAASGLPSLVAGILGAKKVVMTDYPDVEIVQNMQKNIDICDEADEVKGKIAEAVDAVGFIWGADSGPLLARLPPSHQKFDVLILADLLFRHSEHGALVKTIKECLCKKGVAYVFFTSYRPWMREKDLNFFEIAKTEGFKVEQVRQIKLDKPMFDGDPGDLDVQKTVTGFEVRWPEQA